MQLVNRINLFSFCLLLALFPNFSFSKDVPLSQAKAEKELSENLQYFNRHCRSTGSTSSECAQANSAIIYIYLFNKDYSSALSELEAFPAYLPNEFTNCQGLRWSTEGNGRGDFYWIDRWAAISISNKKTASNKEFQPVQYIHSYLCHALLSSPFGGSAPSNEFPISDHDFIALAPKYVSAKSVAIMTRFEEEIARPYREAHMEIFKKNPKPSGSSFKKSVDNDVKIYSLHLELMKNAKNEAKSRGFPERYYSFFDDLINEARYMIELSEKVRNN